jgi:hypothetical protein
MTAWRDRAAGRSLDTYRARAFAVATSLLVLVAVGLSVAAGSRAPATADDAGVEQAAVVAPTFDDAPDPSGAPGDDRGPVVRQARRFLRGYLPYLYGQGPARAIRGSTDVLRRRLTAARLRVPPAARRRHPRVVRVVADPLDLGRWHVVATVADGGVSRYPIELLITTGAGGVRVAEVSSQ